MTKSNLPQIATAAFAAQNITGCPGLVMIAQCGLETGWLRSAPGNNCFGIKAYPGCHGRQLLHTTEWFTDAEARAFLALDAPNIPMGGGRTADLIHPVETAPNGRHKYAVQDWFSTFETLGDCFAKRAEIWDKGRYAPAADEYKADGDLPKFVRAMAPIYALDPKYADMVLSIIRQPDVQDAWRAAQLFQS